MGGESVDNDRESAIQLHLQEWLQTLEDRLANPKNTWKRIEEIQSQIDDAKKRLAAVQRRDKRFSTRRSYPPRSDQERSPRPVRSSAW